MEALVPVLVVLVIAGLIIYAIDHAPAPISGPVKPWLSVIVAVLAAGYLAQRFLL